MLLKKVLLLPLFLLLIGVASAELDLTDQIQELQQDLQGTEIPGIAGTLIGNQRINIRVGISDTEQITIGIIAEENKIKSVAVAEVKDPTLEVYTTEQTVQKILAAENPLSQLKKSLSGKEITYAVRGWFNKIKFNSVVILFKWFGPSAEAVAFTENNSLNLSVSEPVEPESVEIEEELVTESEVESTAQPEERETVHTIGLVEVGFPVKDITLQVGDTLVWNNERQGLRYDKAMILGTQKCARAKSPLYGVGGSYNYTFTQKGACLIVDGVYTTEMMTVIVE